MPRVGWKRGYWYIVYVVIVSFVGRGGRDNLHVPAVTHIAGSSRLCSVKRKAPHSCKTGIELVERSGWKVGRLTACRRTCLPLFVKRPQSPAGNDSIVPFQQVDVPSALPNRSEFPHQSMHVPLTIQYNTSMVPETPGADLSISFRSIKAEPASSHRAEPGMPLKGTPSAIGALCIWRSMVNLPFAGMPLQNAWFGLTPGRMHDPTAQVHAVLGKRQKTELDFSDSVDEDHEEFNQQEAYLLLDIARAQATVRRLEQQLVHAKLDENIALGNLYKCRAQESERRLENAEAELGCIRNSIRMSGGKLCDDSARKRRRRISGSSSDAVLLFVLLVSFAHTIASPCPVFPRICSFLLLQLRCLFGRRLQKVLP
ncbi:hypothetical protein EDD15DRAFT_2204161 [Pisolithus albus]|nr:hypothetical protein EDD15DRAFT_2204161 [Pisolithus albus]